MTIAFGAIGTKAGGGNATTAYPSGVSAGDMAIGATAYWSSGVLPTDVSGWTRTNIEGGTGSSVDAHISMARGDYKELTGSESGNVTFTATGIGGCLACIARYTKTAASWDTVATTTADDNTHGANRSTSGAGSISWQVGDMCVVVVATDTDTALTITSPAITATNVTFGTTTRQTSGAGNTTGQDGNVEVFDALVTGTSGSPTTAPSLSFTTATSQCGPVVFIRLRELAVADPTPRPIYTPNRAAYQRASRW